MDHQVTRVLQASVLLPIICGQDKCGKCFQSLADCLINSSLHGEGRGRGREAQAQTEDMEPDPAGKGPRVHSRHPGLPQHHQAGGQDSEIAVLGNLAPWSRCGLQGKSFFYLADGDSNNPCSKKGAEESSERTKGSAGLGKWSAEAF